MVSMYYTMLSIVPFIISCNDLTSLTSNFQLTPLKSYLAITCMVELVSWSRVGCAKFDIQENCVFECFMAEMFLKVSVGVLQELKSILVDFYSRFKIFNLCLYRITLLGPVRGSEAPCLGTPGERLAVLLWAV